MRKPNEQDGSISFRLVAILLAFVCVVFSSQPSQAQTFSVLHRFNGFSVDGRLPSAGLVIDAAGNLYGTTLAAGKFGGGTVFKVDQTGKETVLYNFWGGQINKGVGPNSVLLLDAAGNLYGTTREGGDTTTCNSGTGCGTIFKLDTSGRLTTLHRFQTPEGGDSFAGLIRDAAGNFYGTTSFFGRGTLCICGTVFKLSSSGTLTVLHSFYSRADDGSMPFAGLVQDQFGNLFGTTSGGGTFGFGTVFKLDPAGRETTLHNFNQDVDGSLPAFGSLVRDSAGNLYGTTESGGDPICKCGTVFKLDTAGTLTVLHSFKGGMDGAGPQAGLIVDPSGNFYGTTTSGGNGFGTVFKVSSNGTETVLYRFTGKADGFGPISELVRDAAGNLYGTASYGGNFLPVCGSDSAGHLLGCGVVFKVTP